MKDEIHLAAYIAITAWGTIILADVAGLIGPSRYEDYALVILYLMSCFGLHYIRSAGQAMPWIITWGGGLVLAWYLFIFYGNLLPNIELQDFVTPPSFASLLLLYLNGPLAALITSLAFAYPLAVIYGRFAGILSVVIALPVFALDATNLIEADAKTITFTIMAFETICLYVFLRIVPRAVYKLAPKRPNGTDT